LELVASTAGSVAPQSLSPAAPVRAAASEQVETGVVAEALSPSAIPTLLSIVIPVYNEEGNLDALYARLLEVLDRESIPFELLFVDDGSKDGTWDKIEQLRAQDSRVRALRHRRNFGKAQGLANGFAVARGDVIITMDGDLQDDPDELPRFLSKLDEGYDLVSGWKQRRKDPLGKTAPSKVFNWTVRKASGVQLHDFNCGFKAYRKDVTENIRLYGELHRFTPVLANAEGFRVAELPVKHNPRTWGTSKYGWSRLVKGFLDLLTVVFLTNYRQRPMHLFGIPGILSIFLGFVLGVYLSIERLVLDQQIGTRPLLWLTVLLIMVGTQFFGLGLLGEFLAHDNQSDRRTNLVSVREAIGIELPDVATNA
jgi:glycosyltransferase involved in cell wall biosynthesis